MIEDNWLFGAGPGEFKIQYNKHQADFFSTRDINSREALLADHTVYAFNDYFQLMTEHGVIGFLLFLFALLALLRLLWYSLKRQSRRPEVTSAAASLLCIAAAAVFSYPLQIFPIIFQALVCLALINAHSGVAGQTIRFAHSLRRLPAPVLIAGALFAGAVSYCKYRHAWKSARAFELQRTGFKQQALKTYEELSNGPIPDGHVLYMYARELYNSNQLHAAAAVCERAKRYHSLNSLYKLSAQANSELKNFSEAGRDYRIAVYMVPNRMMNRYDLLEHYVAVRDTANILYWSKSIIGMPIKVPSPLTSNIQAKAKSILDQFEKPQ
jgi:tetratricopeptide (TPR) repeat protein